MSNNKLVDFIGNIIKSTGHPEGQVGVDDALDIAHTVGNALNIVSNNDNQK